MNQLGSPASSLDDFSDQYHSQSLEGRIATENEKDRPLSHLTVYVEIFSNGTNISDASYRYLETLGATVEKRLNRKCNLVIWKDGPLKTVERARSYAIPVVNSRWLEACLEDNTCADFNKYLPNLPATHDLPFASASSKKKRKATDSSEENFTFESLSSSKPSLKKKKKNDAPDMSQIEKRITIKLNTMRRSLNNDDDDDKKFIRRSQTMGAPTLGSWLLKPSDKKSFIENEENDENESEDSRSISKREPETSIISQVDSERIKKEKEEESAKVRSILSKYTRASSLGAIETTARKSWLDEKDDDKEKKPSALQERPRRKFSRSSSESSERGRRGKSSPLVMDKAHSSSDGGEEYDPLGMSNASASSFSLKTRLSLREEDLAYKQRREKEKEEEEKARASRLSEGKKVGHTSDIGAIARQEMKKIERSDIGKISALYSKYTGKSVSATASATKSMEEEPEEKKSARGVSKGKTMEEEVEEEKKERRKSLRHRMDQEESDKEEEEAPIKTRGRAAAKGSEKKGPEVSTESAVKTKKLETPAKKAETSSVQTSVTKTPTTAGTPSLMKSSFLSKYLDSASSSVSPDVKKSESRRKSPSPPQKETRGVINLKSKFTEEDEEEVLAKTTIKKKTNQKDEKTVFFTGLSVENSGKAKEFCEKFGLKFLEDEVRNLSRAEMLVYEGKEMPHNLRTAYTMVRNKPIVTKAWLDECLKQGKVVDHKKYQREYDAKVRQGLFKDMRFNIDKEYEGLKGNMVTKGDLVGLIEAAGGKVFENVRSCDLYLSRVSKPAIEIPPHVKVITLQWVIDSIIEGKRQSTDKVNFGSIEF